MRRDRRVKVVATLGPASSATEMIERLFLAGVDVFRINMSHSSHEAARALQNSVRWVAKRHRHPIGILADLQGPKLRVGEFPGGRAFINDGAIFKFRPRGEARLQRERVPAASADFRRRRAGPHAAARRRQDPHARHREEARRHHGRGSGRRRARQPQGHQPARHASCPWARSPRRTAPISRTC